jgi:predicted PurR-regulated permease PerM
VTGGGPGERRRVERRANARVSELTLPEFRRIVVTSLLFAAVLVLFIWMVRTVIIAAILGAVIAAYLGPLHAQVRTAIRGRNVAALLTLAVVILPVLTALVFSYLEILDVARYLGAHEDEVARHLESGLLRFGLFGDAHTVETVRDWVLRVAAYATGVPREVRRSVAELSVSTTIFLFTAFYILTDGPAVAGYVREKIPPRYAELAAALEGNVRGVLYGAVYATLLTQALKSGVVFLLNLAFDVPLAGVLAILSFLIGFFPIVGSWTVYVPVALWLLVWRGQPLAALLMIAAGFLVNTLFISTYLRPKLAAEKSRVLNFYWMFLGLVTGVYTFGLAGILLGPILIGLLKAVIDTVTSTSSWQSIESEGQTPADTATTGVVA